MHRRSVLGGMATVVAVLAGCVGAGGPNGSSDGTGDGEAPDSGVADNPSSAHDGEVPVEIRERVLQDYGEALEHAQAGMGALQEAYEALDLEEYGWVARDAEDASEAFADALDVLDDVDSTATDHDLESAREVITAAEEYVWLLEAEAFHLRQAARADMDDEPETREEHLAELSEVAHERDRRELPALADLEAALGLD